MPQIAGREVGPIGFGLMSLTRPGNGLSDDDAFAVLKTALAAGANFWNGGEFYGPEDNNSLVLLEKYFAKYPGDADKVVLSIKGGSDKPNTYHFDSSRANVRRSVHDSVAQLKGRKKIDLFEVGRQDGVTPWEETVAAMQELVDEGRFGHIALSESKAETIHRVAKLAKVAAVEEELSLLTPDILSDGVAAAAAQYDIPVVAYSPLGRGLLTGKIQSQDDLNPSARRFPRFSPDNLAANLKLVEALKKFAAQKGCTPGQLAINWARCQSLRPGAPRTIIPIPGGTTVARVQENTKVVDLTVEDLDAIDAIVRPFEVKGERYPAGLPTKA